MGLSAATSPSPQSQYFDDLSIDTDGNSDNGPETNLQKQLNNLKNNPQAQVLVEKLLQYEQQIANNTSGELKTLAAELALSFDANARPNERASIDILRDLVDRVPESLTTEYFTENSELLVGDFSILFDRYLNPTVADGYQQLFASFRAAQLSQITTELKNKIQTQVQAGDKLDAGFTQQLTADVDYLRQTKAVELKLLASKDGSAETISLAELREAGIENHSSFSQTYFELMMPAEYPTLAERKAKLTTYLENIAERPATAHTSASRELLYVAMQLVGDGRLTEREMAPAGATPEENQISAKLRAIDSHKVFNETYEAVLKGFSSDSPEYKNLQAAFEQSSDKKTSSVSDLLALKRPNKHERKEILKSAKTEAERTELDALISDGIPTKLLAALDLAHRIELDQQAGSLDTSGTALGKHANISNTLLYLGVSNIVAASLIITIIQNLGDPLSLFTNSVFLADVGILGATAHHWGMLELGPKAGKKEFKTKIVKLEQNKDQTVAPQVKQWLTAIDPVQFKQNSELERYIDEQARDGVYTVEAAELKSFLPKGADIPVLNSEPAKRQLFRLLNHATQYHLVPTRQLLKLSKK